MPSFDTGIGDIEDAVGKDDLTPHDRIGPKRSVLPKATSKRMQRNGRVEEGKPIGDSVIPGTQCIYVRTWGCSHNNSDSEYMAGQLAAYGYKITGKGEITTHVLRCVDEKKNQQNRLTTHE